MLRPCNGRSFSVRLEVLFLLFFSIFKESAFSSVTEKQVDDHRNLRRHLPEKVLVAYATHCDDHVAKAVREGVNVVIWAFMGIRKESDGSVVPKSGLDFDCIRDMITELDYEGYDDTLHLVSFGGWNGGHLDPNLTAEEWYQAWKGHVGDLFHGIDWDLEGDNDLEKATNVFTLDCLEKMGCISQLAKDDGYIISMAPPQSYMDPQSSKFSRHVNLTEPDRPWHNEFHYFGANVCSYLLSKYGDYIDFISLQFYESYSRAAMSVYHYGISPAAYLQFYVNDLVTTGQTYQVNFEEDPTLKYPSQRVALPLSKLVFGFANGWAAGPGEKAIFFDPEDIDTAYQSLTESGNTPRGFMYWVIGEEGKNGVYYTNALNKILKIR
jgi:beta-glucosidase